MSAGAINFSSVSLGLLRRYLHARRWSVEGPRLAPEEKLGNAAARLFAARSGKDTKRNFDLFVSSESALEGLELVVPRDNTGREYGMLVERIIRALASIEDRDEVEIVRSIREVGFDVVRSRVPDTYVLNDTIYLSKAESFITGIRNVLAATAMSELEPAPYFIRVRKEATEYANRCRFGHTFRGSFGFTVESPLEANDQFQMFDAPPAPPFERKVVERLARGFATISKAVATDSTAPIIENAKNGFSANVCEQIARLVEDTAHASLIFEFSFSPEWKTAVTTESGVDPEEGFVVGPQHVEVAREAAKEMRKAPDPTQETVVGRVIKLASQADPTDLEDVMGEREVDLLWSSERLGDISVRTSLSPADYLTALDAHRAGRAIAVSGMLQRRGRSWRLIDPRMVRVP